MQKFRCLPILIASYVLAACGDGPTNPSRPSTTTTTTSTSAPASQLRIQTLLTVYPNGDSLAMWTQGSTEDERIGRILLGVETLTEGTTILNNEGLRVQLQEAIDRIDEGFSEADYRAAFDETRENLLRFLNDADGDGWSIDGRNGAGRDWPFDEDGNDPDGWTSQMIVTVTRN